jgi:nucleoside-diphosphate-sugar epimerase
MKKIFVTGGTGFVGRYFIQKALKEKYFIYATSRKKNKNKKNLKWLKGDFSYNWKRELRNSDTLIHFASAGVYNKKLNYNQIFEVNVVRSLKLLINAINSGCKKWILIGSCSENIFEKNFNKFNIGNNYNYALSKFLFTKLASFMAKKFKCKCHMMKLFQVYGYGEKKTRLWTSLVNAAKNGNNLNLSMGYQKRDFISVDHAVKLIINSLKEFNKTSKRYVNYSHIATGKNMTVKEFSTKLWTKMKAKGRLQFGKLKGADYSDYISKKKLILRQN